MPEPDYAIQFGDTGNSPGPASWAPDVRVWWDDEGRILRIETWGEQAKRLHAAIREHGLDDPAALLIALNGASKDSRGSGGAAS